MSSFSEIPSGTIDGVNKTFTLTYTPVTGSDQLFLNGVLQQRQTEYVVSGKSVAYTTAPIAGDWHFIHYDVAGGLPGLITQLGDIANWVAERLNRHDIFPQLVEDAKAVYLLVCVRVPFDQLMVTTIERQMQVGVSSYDLSDISPPLAGISSIRIKYSSSSSRRLRRSHTRIYDALGISTPNGRPYSYARWGNSIEVQPPPDLSTYTYRVRYWSYPAFNDVDLANTILVTPPEWDELMKYETLHRAYIFLDQLEKATALVFTAPPGMRAVGANTRKVVQFETAIIPRLWNDLLKTVSNRENVDEDFGLNPVVRSYTNVGVR